MEDYEQDFEDFWKSIVCNPDGSINLDQIKKELYDWHNVMGEVSKVYDHVSGGKISKVTTMAQHVIDAHEEEISDAYDRGYEDGIKEEK